MGGSRNGGGAGDFVLRGGRGGLAHRGTGRLIAERHGRASSSNAPAVKIGTCGRPSRSRTLPGEAGTPAEARRNVVRGRQAKGLRWGLKVTRFSQ